MNNNIRKIIEYSKIGVISKQLEKENFNVTLFCMSKETEISNHTSTKKAFIYVIEGKGIFNKSDKKIIMGKDTIITLKENEVHSINAEEEMSFLLVLA
jgi:nitric oxide dioxygenase